MNTPVTRIIDELTRQGKNGSIDVDAAQKIVKDMLNEHIHSTLPISRMLTVSTSHVKEDTFEAMMLDGVQNKIMLPIYGKSTADNGSSFGLYVYINPGLINWDDIPEDLAPVLKYSMKYNCDVLCLDSDGMEIEELPVYEWED